MIILNYPVLRLSYVDRLYNGNINDSRVGKAATLYRAALAPLMLRRNVIYVGRAEDIVGCSVLFTHQTHQMGAEVWLFCHVATTARDFLTPLPGNEKYKVITSVLQSSHSRHEIKQLIQT